MTGRWTKGVCSAHCCDAVPTSGDDGRRFVDIFVGEVIFSPFDQSASGNLALGDRIASVWAESHRLEERDANAALIAEAFNVANETGLTPRQLADQRAELLVAAQMLADLYHGKGNGRSFPTQEQCDFAAAVIAKCTGAA